MINKNKNKSKSSRSNSNFDNSQSIINYDTNGFSRDPVERAMQISKIMHIAEEGDTKAKEWIDEYKKTSLLPTTSDYMSLIKQNNNDSSTSQNIINPLEHLMSFKISNPDKYHAEYNEFMDKFIERVNNGDEEALKILEEQDFTFVQTEDQPFNPKVFNTYQEHNKFMIEMEKNYIPPSRTEDPELIKLSAEMKKQYTQLLQAEGRNKLYEREIKELKQEISRFVTEKKRLEKEKENLEKFVEGESDEHSIGGKRLFITRNSRGLVLDFGKIPPQATELEQIVLGSALKSGRLVEDFSQPYLHLMLYKDAHQQIHQAMMKVRGKITIEKVVDKFRATRFDVGQVGGEAYLMQLLEKGIDDEKLLKEYFEIIENKYLRREVIRITSQIQNEAYEDKEIDSISEWVRSKALEFLDIMPYRFKIYYDLKSLVGQTVGNFRKLIDRNGRPEISTGYNNLDRITHGIAPGTLVFTGMRGKNGKTTYTTNIADNVAKQNRHVLIFTYESSREEIIQKLIAKRARVDLEKMSYYDNDNPLTETEKKRIYKASLEVRKLPIIIEGRPAEPEYITRTVKFYKGMYPDLSLVVIDGLQAFTKKEMPKGKNKSDYLYDTLTGFKNELAIDLNLSVWVNGQLKSDVELRKSKRPIGSGDYSDCKAITEVADVAILGYRPGKYFDKPQFKGWIALWPTDVRSGTEHGRACRLGFEGEYANVFELPKEQRKYDYAKYDALILKDKVVKKVEE